MVEPPLDKIHIRDLQLRCVVGIYPQERKEKQDVTVNLTLYADLRAGCASDSIEDTVDYKAVKKKVVATVEDSSCYLVEHLAQRVADVCLEDPRVKRVKVTIDKPGALRFARSVAIEIVRGR
ncbi:MAG TPA: dihydroneopterin aldolase [Candidatus Hydrogenedentes bacterium]|nr:dihydroneopterin aldolase [Candidatus Hydrogenedentota bacterium]HIJ72517.1 dihydroneopterin aldolase [Candidatus Hydrogenedentota bacterium]